ncbi:MAG: hypothetical protein IPG05_02635 [Gemmatimonadetes bacterium]|nr:hypothetical protein [Gemmatimonadota bacterium]
MPASRTMWPSTLTLLALAACGGSGTGPGPVTVTCTTPTPVVLEPGAQVLIDAARTSNCLSLPGGGEAREYLVVAYSGAGTETTSGISTSYALASGATGGGSALLDGLPAPVASFGRSAEGADAFHRNLRRAEARIAADPATRLGNSWGGSPPMASIPIVGQRDSFYVCRTSSCAAFDRVGATVRFVGRQGAIYTDDANPVTAESLTESDITQLGTLFDDYLFPIDTTAFGRESDIDGDQRVAILISAAVNDLTSDCANGRIIGYFYGADLIASLAGSNRREVFYAFAPKAATTSCPAVTRSIALRALPPVLIHELQHMISFNQRVLVRGAGQEDLWLNEGLSHFAEELGYRGVPDARCPNSASCFAQFSSGDIDNAYSYLSDPEATALVTPGNNSGPLAYRGASWLFVRWLADHFSSDTLLGTQVTRGLVQSTRDGATNVSAVAGVDFPTLVGEWQLANYLENLPGFAQVGRLRYRTWNFRSLYQANFPTLFAKPYPLTPDSTAGSYSRTGTLRGGSGRHVRYRLAAGAAGVTVQLTGSNGNGAPSSTAEPRFAVVRIR